MQRTMVESHQTHRWYLHDIYDIFTYDILILTVTGLKVSKSSNIAPKKYHYQKTNV